MLHIILFILKIIGIILAVILGILLVVFCVVLLVPLRYRIEVSAKGTVESIKARVEFSWLLRLAAGFAHYENQEVDWQVRILWKQMNIPFVKKQVEKVEEEIGEQAETITEEMKEEIAKPIKEKDKESKGEKKKNSKSSVSSKTKSSKDESKHSNIKEKKIDICDKIKEVKEFITEEVHLASINRIKLEILRLLRFLKPQEIKANVHFGFADPCMTGQLLAVLSALYPIYANSIDLNPDFENQIIEGDLYLKGKIRVVYAIILVWNLIFDKNIRMTYKDLKKWIR